MLFSIPDNGWNTGLRLYEIIYFRFLSCRFVNQILSQFQPFDKKKKFQDFVICTFFIWTTISQRKAFAWFKGVFLQIRFCNCFFKRCFVFSVDIVIPCLKIPVKRHASVKSTWWSTLIAWKHVYVLELRNTLW